MQLRNLVYVASAFAGALFLLPAPTPAGAAQLETCGSSHTDRYCTSVPITNDPDYPCQTQNGNTYCPIVKYYYPHQGPIPV